MADEAGGTEAARNSHRTPPLGTHMALFFSALHLVARKSVHLGCLEVASYLGGATVPSCGVVNKMQNKKKLKRDTWPCYIPVGKGKSDAKV